MVTKFLSENSDDLPAAVRERAESLPDYKTQGTASGPSIEYAENVGGVKRTRAEALALAEKYGVEFPDDVDVRFVKDYELHNTVGAKAEYGTMGSKPGTAKITWDDLKNDDGMVVVRISESVLTSDESIVGHLAHEAFELDKIYNAIGNGATMTYGRFFFNTADQKIGGSPNNWHEKAWDYSNKIVEGMRD